MTESREDLLHRIAELEKEVKRNRGPLPLSLKVSEKGAVSVYGLGRFPVTLYYEQWKKLLSSAAEIETFLEEHRANLKLKE